MNQIPTCPDSTCVNHENAKRTNFFKDGSFKLKDGRKVQKYRCRACGKCLSTSTMTEKPNLKRLDLTAKIFKLYSSRMTIRRIAETLECSKDTVQSHIEWLGKRCREYHNEAINVGWLNTYRINFDEMETYEHTKLKPISIALAVDAVDGNIIDMKACIMPARGPAAKFARDKYGNRPDFRPTACREIIRIVRRIAAPRSVIYTDGKLLYRTIFGREIPEIEHIPIRNEDARERQIEGLDELFWLNHACAMIRQDLSRLTRETWITTKKMRLLQSHLNIYIAYYNEYDIDDIIKGKKPKRVKPPRMRCEEIDNVTYIQGDGYVPTQEEIDEILNEDDVA